MIKTFFVRNTFDAIACLVSLMKGEDFLPYTAASHLAMKSIQDIWIKLGSILSCLSLDTVELDGPLMMCSVKARLSG